MSGSSLDGVDLANCQFVVQNEPEFEIINWEITVADIIPFPVEILQKLENVTKFNGLKLTEFDHELGSVFGEMILKFCEKHQLKPDVIASHGHTVYHYPKKRLTLQIGHPSNIAAITGYPVIGDFRSIDVALGGQGAPFAPIVDLYLFSQYQALINLGGIVNISFIKENKKLIAFDVCPGNQILDYLSKQKGFAFDIKGEFARNGRIESLLLKQLTNWPYFKLPIPKSLDNTEIRKTFLTLINNSNGTIEDKLHTMTLLIAFMIKKSFDSVNLTKNQKVLITGGGAFNDYLVEQIKKELVGKDIVIPEPMIVNFKEALLMGLMGLLRIYNKNNVLCSVTGSSMDHCTGAIYPGKLKIPNEDY